MLFPSYCLEESCTGVRCIHIPKSQHHSLNAASQYRKTMRKFLTIHFQILHFIIQRLRNPESPCLVFLCVDKSRLLKLFDTEYLEVQALFQQMVRSVYSIDISYFCFCHFFLSFLNQNSKISHHQSFQFTTIPFINFSSSIHLLGSIFS